MKWDPSQRFWLSFHLDTGRVDKQLDMVLDFGARINFNLWCYHQ
jgi:hypothetical protein